MIAISSIISLLGVVLCTCKLVVYHRDIYILRSMYIITSQTICAH